MTSIELLAPARDLECGIAAIQCGADAVYIGAPRFGARENAGNSLDDIAALIQYAHQYWAKVYVTLNTLLQDDELNEAVELINRLYELGADGLIIQDMGLLECQLPPIPLITSTQMHNHTPERIAFLEKVGMKRAILARELSLEQIRTIRHQTQIELECFIHGALCVSYSGQCYLSYALGGRSGNRGQCAQPCRKLYQLIDRNGRVLEEDHLLSLKDLNLSEHLRDLIDAGVCSFKIEGRLKDKTYVLNIVAHYRRLLDLILAEKGLSRSSSGTSHLDLEPNPDKTFNRGYCTYFLNGRGKPIGSPETPKMVGELVGRVISVQKKEITLETHLKLNTGDGITYFNAQKELCGTVVNGVSGNRISVEKTGRIRPGTLVYRNHDHAFLTQLKKSSPERTLGIQMSLSESPDGFRLSVIDEDQIAIEFSLPCEKVLAEKPEKALENIEKQLQKTGGTLFRCDQVTLQLSSAYFMPISYLNALRRGALDLLTSARLQAHPQVGGGVSPNSVPYPATKLTYEGNVLNRSAEAFYRRHGVIQIEPAAESGLDLKGRKVMTTRYCLKDQFGVCPRNGKLTSLVEPLYLVDEEGNRLKLRFCCDRCEMEVYLDQRAFD